MRKILFYILFTSTYSFAQNSLSGVGGKSWGMGNAMVALPHSQTFFYNPAGLGFVENSFVNSSFDSRFDIVGLSTMSLSAVVAKKWATVAIGAERFGDQLYNENKAGIAIAKSTERVSLGVKVSYLGNYAEGFSSRNTLVTEFGVMAYISPKITIGMHAYNLTGASLYDFEKIPTTIRLGGAFQPTSKITIAAETEFIPSGKPFFKAGLEYMLFENFHLRTGMNSGIRTNHFGVGYAYKKWVFDYAVNTHPTLGLSHHFSLQLNLPKK
ncbi:hypothetical protein [Arcticibacterium luteifluviistationis]|uniref:PorV/PorQ family protein n=1 Tax=Arcticibacterium luteifluviistationis TaxID=1784714 RepID=A0A2Z4G9M3_9BACT|nr:hypothetical protein [Arcticibacterium luteifluviistationis]AWV97886.1 hypothetical protein DJ013_06780 [Arcticibacterium luteifluviistationis]